MQNNQNNTNPQPQNPQAGNNSPIIPPANNTNQNSIKEGDELLSDAKLQLDSIASESKEEMEKELNIIQKIRTEMNMPGAFTAEEGITNLERNMRALNMPGIFEKTRASDLINLREEAIIEKNNLDSLGRNWNMQPSEEQDEIADRVRWGANCQDLWQLIIIRRDIRGIKFKASAEEENEKQSQQDLINMVINEIELDLSRNPETREKAKDSNYIKDKAKQIALSTDFLTLMNSQTKNNINVGKIREEIENKLEENPTNDLKGNIQPGS